LLLGKQYWMGEIITPGLSRDEILVQEVYEKYKIFAGLFFL
jgi:hypothetical protein